MDMPSSPLPSPSSPALSALSEGLEEARADAPRDMAATLAFVLSRSPGAETRGVLLAATRAWLRENGRPYGPGLAAFGRREAFVLVSTRTEAEALWAMEQALRSGGLNLVLGAVEGAELAQTRRLEFAARDGASAGVLLRHRGGDLSAARRRWRITTLASKGDAEDHRAPGRFVLRAELTRSRLERSGIWMLEQDDETHRLRLADRLAGDGPGAVGRLAV
jgi:protein ImuA